MPRYILTAGWNRFVRVYRDGRDDDDDDDDDDVAEDYWEDCAGCKNRWRIAHDEDILCMALLRPMTVVTASYDGDIVVWSLDNGHTLARFNADMSTRSLRSTTKPVSPSRRRYSAFIT